jgi:hypothetical protein
MGLRMVSFSVVPGVDIYSFVSSSATTQKGISSSTAELSKLNVTSVLLPGPISRNSYVDDRNYLTIVTSLPPILNTMSWHRDIYIYGCYGMITQCQRGDDTKAE